MPEVKFCAKCQERIDEEMDEYRVIDASKGQYQHLECHPEPPEIIGAEGYGLPTFPKK